MSGYDFDCLFFYLLRKNRGKAVQFLTRALNKKHLAEKKVVYLRFKAALIVNYRIIGLFNFRYIYGALNEFYGYSRAVLWVGS